MASTLAAELAGHMNGLRDVLAAERGTLRLRATRVIPSHLLAMLRESYASTAAAVGARIEIRAFATPPLVTDEALLARVLGSLLANAIEASGAGDVVVLRHAPAGDRATFTVHNPGVMPQAVRVQVFQRGFSTRGAGRGLGTYGARLIAERYLGGTLRFGSNTATGTVFALDLPVLPPR
jgi:signal transduction histidine kinase